MGDLLHHQSQHRIREKDRELLGIAVPVEVGGLRIKEMMTTSKVPVIEQFLAGRPEGPIGMDEMAHTVGDTSDSDDDAALQVPSPPSPHIDTVPHRVQSAAGNGSELTTTDPTPAQAVVV